MTYGRPEKRRSFGDRLLRRPPSGMQTDMKYGFKIFHDPMDAELDIVFIHGITGHREHTWTSGSGRPWPEALLPTKIPQARILSFGYDAGVVNWRPRLSSNRIDDHAKNLMVTLAGFREVDDTNNRPLLFVCHSLGGLICEDALLSSRASFEPHLQRILDCTRGILFLGTPHSGSSLAVVGQRLARLASVASRTNLRLVEVLRRDSEVLARIQDEFHSILRLRGTEGQNLIDITCIYEELPIPGIGEVVPKHSAVIPGYTSIGLHANHRDIARFETSTDPGFITVANELQRWAKNIRQRPFKYIRPRDASPLGGTRPGSLYPKSQHIGGVIIYGDILQSNVINGSQIINGGIRFGD